MRSSLFALLLASTSVAVSEALVSNLPFSSRCVAGTSKLHSSPSDLAAEWASRNSGSADQKTNNSRPPPPPVRETIDITPEEVSSTSSSPPPPQTTSSSPVFSWTPDNEQKKSNPLQDFAQATKDAVNQLVDPAAKNSDYQKQQQPVYKYSPSSQERLEGRGPPRPTTASGNGDWWDVASSSEFSVIPERAPGSRRPASRWGDRQQQQQPRQRQQQNAQWHDVQSTPDCKPLSQGGNSFRRGPQRPNMERRQNQEYDWRHSSSGRPISNGGTGLDKENNSRRFGNSQNSMQQPTETDWRYKPSGQPLSSGGNPSMQRWNNNSNNNRDWRDTSRGAPISQGGNVSRRISSSSGTENDWRYSSSGRPLSTGGNTDRRSEVYPSYDNNGADDWRYNNRSNNNAPLLQGGNVERYPGASSSSDTTRDGDSWWWAASRSSPLGPDREPRGNGRTY